MPASTGGADAPKPNSVQFDRDSDMYIVIKKSYKYYCLLITYQLVPLLAIIAAAPLGTSAVLPAVVMPMSTILPVRLSVQVKLELFLTVVTVLGTDAGSLRVNVLADELLTI
jgi:hypothetical protein